jgi:mannosyltransferase
VDSIVTPWRPGAAAARHVSDPGGRRPGDRPAVRTELLVLAAIVLVAVGVRWLPLQRGLGFDELFTAVNFVSAESAWRTASTSINFNNHVAYSLLARGSVSLFGRAEWALRLPALLLGLAALPLLWRLSRPVVGPRSALAATLGLALSPEHVLWSTTARGYTGLLLGVLLATGLLFRLLDRPSLVVAGAFGLTTAITAYFHLYAVPVAVAQGTFLLVLLVLTTRRCAGTDARRGILFGLLGLFVAGVLTVVLYLPIVGSLLFSVQHAGRGDFWPGFAWSVAQEQTGGAGDWLVVAILAVAALGVISLGRGHARLVAYGLTIVLLPLLLMTLARPVDLYARFFVYLLPFLLVALAAGGATTVQVLARRLPPRRSWLTRVPAAAGAVLLLLSWARLYPDFLDDEGLRAGARALTLDADLATTLCAVGAGAELFQWYVDRPLALPKTVNELQRVLRGSEGARCVTRRTSWETRSSAEVRRYLEERSTAERFGDATLYRVRGRQ